GGEDDDETSRKKHRRASSFPFPPSLRRCYPRAPSKKELFMRNSIVLVLFAFFALAGCSKPEPISQTHQGRIEQGDQVLQVDNSLYDSYSFEAAEGMTITATMVSTEFDAYLHLIDAAGNQLVQNDDDATMGEG